MRDTGKLPVVLANDLRILCHTIAHWCGRDGEVWREQSLAMLDKLMDRLSEVDDRIVVLAARYRLMTELLFLQRVTACESQAAVSALELQGETHCN